MLLLFAVINGLYFGLSSSKMIISTMSGKALETPTIESLFYLIAIIVGLILPDYEGIIVVIICLFITIYFIRYFGSIVGQLLKELKITKF